MNWLLWKDYRQNRLVVFVGLFLLLIPHIIALLATWYDIVHGSKDLWIWQRNFTGSCLYSLCLSQLTIALIGGNAIAGERADRSAEFLASLPISRRKNLASKLLLAMVIVAVIWLLNAPTSWHLAKWVNNDFTSHHLGRLYANTAIVGLVFFGVSWGLSSFLSSPAYAVCGGLTAPLFVGSGFLFFDYLFGLPHNPVGMEFLFSFICLNLALVSFGLGTWYYLRRVEP